MAGGADGPAFAWLRSRAGCEGREGCGWEGREILRCAQDDSGGDKGVAGGADGPAFASLRSRAGCEGGEGSDWVGGEILRCAQDDKRERRAQDDRARGKLRLEPLARVADEQTRGETPFPSSLRTVNNGPRRSHPESHGPGEVARLYSARAFLALGP